MISQRYSGKTAAQLALLAIWRKEHPTTPLLIVTPKGQQVSRSAADDKRILGR